MCVLPVSPVPYGSVVIPYSPTDHLSGTIHESRTSQRAYVHICVMVIVMEPRGPVQLSNDVNRLLLLELKGGEPEQTEASDGRGRSR